MDLRHFLLSFDGRISRAQWWAFSIPYALLVSLLYLSQAERAYAAPVILMVSVVATYMWLAVNIKRCHDRGRSGWFVILSLLPLANIWYLIEVGFLRGQSGPNKYGPDPKATVVSPSIFGSPSHPQPKAGL
jgi:uncharacterized membrane protein YhaH (DUF805 family)